MSRFGNLEFGREFGEEANQFEVKDEAFFAARAQRAFEQSEFEPALRYYAKVLEFNPQNTGAWAGQVRALVELGEFREAKLWADKALERFPRDPELLAAKAVALGRCGDLDEALAFSDASIEERGDTPYLWLARGDVLLAREESRADYCFEKALMLAPKNWFVAWLAARVRCFYKQFAPAVKLLRQALEWEPGQSGLWLLLGQCQQQLGLPGPAAQAFTQALQLEPRSPAARLALDQLSSAGPGAHLLGWWRQLFRR